MKMGEKEARPHTSNERALNLLLMATRRDPAFVKPVFNLGVVCEMSERWEDALSFFKIVPSLEQDPRILETANSEVERLKIITAMVATPEGRRTRDFDIALVNLLNAKIEPVLGVERAESLVKQDRTRWEAPALAAEMYAAQEKYAEAARSLEAAAHVAPSDKRASLIAAAEIAGAQAKYQELVDRGVKSWEDKKYSDAARFYQEAWDVDHSHLDTGIDSAVSYLMADQIKEAVTVLSLLLQNGADDSAQKIKAMLKQLTPVSVEAKDALNNSDGGVAAPAVRLSAADRIAKAVGALASAEVRLIARPMPAFIDEQLAAFESLPDAELTSPELAKLSPEGLFDQYQHGVPALPQSPLPGETLSITPPATAARDLLGQPSMVPNAEQARPATPPDRPNLVLPRFRPSTPPKDPDKPVPPPQ
jgi:tetratricopeptide (TPR) repeat protein